MQLGISAFIYLFACLFLRALSQVILECFLNHYALQLIIIQSPFCFAFAWVILKSFWKGSQLSVLSSGPSGEHVKPLLSFSLRLRWHTNRAPTDGSGRFGAVQLVVWFKLHEDMLLFLFQKLWERSDREGTAGLPFTCTGEVVEKRK